jgi:8-oxo-dGTP pyrophosphatase MutT (NUDIX family)
MCGLLAVRCFASCAWCALAFLFVGDVAGSEPGRWRTFGERVIYESPGVWLGQVDVSLPSRERLWQHVLRLHRAVAVALLDGHGGVLLVRRFRVVQDRWGWELPGGLVDDDEGPDEAAVRELEAQTGYAAGQLERLIVFQPVAEIVDGERVVFVGRGPQHVGEPVNAEGIDRAEWVPLASVGELIASGDVWNGSSVVGLLSVLAQLR